MCSPHLYSRFDLLFFIIHVSTYCWEIVLHKINVKGGIYHLGNESGKVQNGVICVCIHVYGLICIHECMFSGPPHYPSLSTVWMQLHHISASRL